MRQLWLWTLAAFVVWPIHSNAAMIGDKPIDLLLSDLLLFAVPLAYFWIRSEPANSQHTLKGANNRTFKSSDAGYPALLYIAIICIVYMTAIAGIGLGISGETIRVFSAFKLVKPMTFVLIGWILGTATDPLKFIDLTGIAYGIVVGLTMFCTVTAPQFPMGFWGQYIFGFELSGYPNTPMSFYGGLVPLLLATSDSTKKRSLRLVGWGLAACSTLMILGSMSRSSLITLVCGTVIYLARTDRKMFLASSAMTVILVSIVGFGAFTALQETEIGTTLIERVNDRFQRSTESDDPTSGRLEIWQFAIELSAEKPIFGYMFESFSRYTGDVDTPHQQYLEVLYKCGGLGLLLYIALLWCCLYSSKRLLQFTVRKSPAWYRLHAMSAMLIGILIGNLTQPNLTYSLTGNMVFFLFGSLCSSRAALSASMSDEPFQATIVRSKPLPRIAA